MINHSFSEPGFTIYILGLLESFPPFFLHINSCFIEESENYFTNLVHKEVARNSFLPPEGSCFVKKLLAAKVKNFLAIIFINMLINVIGNVKVIYRL